MEPHEIPQNLMKSHRISWNPIEPHGIPWKVLEHSRIFWLLTNDYKWWHHSMYLEHVTICVTLAHARQGLLSNKRGLQESTRTNLSQHKAEPPARLRLICSSWSLALCGTTRAREQECSLWSQQSLRARRSPRLHPVYSKAQWALTAHCVQLHRVPYQYSLYQSTSWLPLHLTAAQLQSPLCTPLVLRLRLLLCICTCPSVKRPSSLTLQEPT
jgi:hypothetical protein